MRYSSKIQVIFIKYCSPCSETSGLQVDEDRSDDFAKGGSVDGFKFVFSAVLLVMRVHETAG